MSRQHHAEDDEHMNSDSFLDIASNIVGILIILVMVAGSRVKSYIEETVQASRTTARVAVAELPKEREQAQMLAGEVGKMTREAARLDSEVQAATYARRRLSDAIALAEQQLAEQRKQLDERQQRRHDAAQHLVAVRRQLDELQREQISLVSTPAPEVTVKSYPSPISKTVFTKEEHFRLLEGKITRVPFEELKNLLLDEKRQLIWKLNDLPEVSGSVGPLSGFRLDYHFVRTQLGGSLTAAYYIPVQADMGEPLATALAAGSDFRHTLDRLDRANTTITVWTYPNSFNDFRLLKQELYKLGFSVAGRPMEKDSRIGFSPKGSKSAAQ